LRGGERSRGTESTAKKAVRRPQRDLSVSSCGIDPFSTPVVAVASIVDNGEIASRSGASSCAAKSWLTASLGDPRDRNLVITHPGLMRDGFDHVVA
jgi:hypothetical protein